MDISKKTEEKMLANGYTFDDLQLVEKNTKNVRCLLCDDNDNDFEKKIPHIKVKDMIGEYDFVTAVCRALKINSAIRDIEGSSNFIYFEKKNAV